MKALFDLREKLCAQLEEPAKEKRLSASSLELVHILTDTIKNIDKILMMSEEGYSQDGMWQADIRGNYSRGNSYANQGQHYVSGHYSRDGMGGYSRNGYSRDGYSRDGYSQDRGRLATMLEGMMADAGNDREREALRRCMQELKAD